MKRCATIFVLLFIALSASQAQPGYSWVSIMVPDRPTLDRIWSAGIDFEGVTGKIGGTMTFLTNAPERSHLDAAGIRYAILPIEQAIGPDYAPGPANALGFGYGSMAGFYTFSEVMAQLDSMRLLYPNLITSRTSLITTGGGRPVSMVKISSNADVDDWSKPEVLFTAMHHAREPEGMMTVVYYMWWLLQHYGTDPRATYLIDHRSIYFVPVVNPDGYVYNEQIYNSSHSFGYWRKNVRDNNGNGVLDSYDGVDLNRNYGPTYMWNAPAGGSSTYPGDDTYRGPSAFSEPETQAIRDFIFGHDIVTCLNYHTYGNDLIYPWGYVLAETPDSVMFREFAFDMTKDNRYVTGTDLQTVRYTTRGNSDDFMYAGNWEATFAMTPEVGLSGFWPPTSQILPLAEGNLTANIYYTFVAGQYSVVTDYAVADLHGTPELKQGEQFTLTASIRNKGLKDAGRLQAGAASTNPALQFTGGSVILGTMPARSDTSVSFTGTVYSSAPVGTPIPVIITLTDSLGYVFNDTVNLIVGSPDVLLSDDAGAGMGQWEAQGGWGISSDAHTAPSCFTDSPTGNYPPLADATLTLRNPLYLFGYSACRLSFWTKWAVEPAADFAMVEVSTDGGTTWTSIRSTLSRIGSGQGIQSPSVWGYDGYSPKMSWVRQEFDLAPFLNTQLLLRFHLMDDGGEERDGWYIDDISVRGYGNHNPPVAFRFTDAGSVTDSIRLDENSFATDAIDTTIGEHELDPVPGAGTFDVRWQIPPSNGSMLNILPTLSTIRDSNVFRAGFQPGPGGYPIQVRWDPTGLRDGRWELRDGNTHGSLLSMNVWTDTAVTISNPSISTLEIVHHRTGSSVLHLKQGWQILSIPVVNDTQSTTGMFPHAVSKAFTYDNRYYSHDTLRNLSGYWLKYPSADSVIFTGIPIVHDTIQVPAGWRMIGGLSYPTSVARFVCDPPPCRPFVYGTGYSIASALDAGQGFWVKGPQTLILSCIPRQTSGVMAPRAAAEIQGSSSISFTDAAGYETTLYLTSAPASGSEPMELPPVPPAGIFDVRFASNTRTALLPGLSGHAERIMLHSAVYPVTLRWNIYGTPLELATQDDAGRAVIPLTGSGTYRLGQLPSEVLTVRTRGTVSPVKNFALEPNYPNPFNPVTTIAFAVPEPVNVTLTVTNLVGEEVRQIYRNNPMAAGRYVIPFDGTGLASGLYVYHFTAVTSAGVTAASFTHKMLLIK